MATLTLNFTANAATIRIPGYSGSDGQAEFSNTTANRDPVVRAIAHEWNENATAAGTVMITAS